MANLTTRERVKLLMGIKDGSQDTKIDAVIAIVSAAAETYCGRKFLTADYEDEIHNGGGEYLRVNEFPIISISSITEDGKALSSEEYTVFPDF
ncbi:MAG: phage head-tail connector protein [Elusimicrobia bacterium]|nr:phage head-tail connector protein [Elusimicrobiota bacterium]